MDAWLKQALVYVPQWLDYQRRQAEVPGCALAIVHKGRLVLERAFGVADLSTGEKLTPRHRFRVASHSKSFTAAGIMKLRERGKLRLDDPVGNHIGGLHPQVAAVTLSQLLSHTAGLVRDGGDAGQFMDTRPFWSEAELRAALAEPLMIAPGSRFKYSNHGFALLGLVIEELTGEPYADWIAREIVGRAKLGETTPDWPPPKGARFSRGHSGKMLLGERLVVPGDNVTGTIAAAGGFISTAADIARFFAGLDPAAKASVLSAASRREMSRRHWRDVEGAADAYYGLGLSMGVAGGWSWFGHGGAFQSGLSRTAVVLGRDLAITVLTNAVDGPANAWSDGVMRILQTFEERGAAPAKYKDWSGRWWNSWRAFDLVAVGDGVLVAAPELANPFDAASEIEVSGRDKGHIRRASGYGAYGEPVRLIRNSKGKVRELSLGGASLVSERRAVGELERKYGAG